MLNTILIVNSLFFIYLIKFIILNQIHFHLLLLRIRLLLLFPDLRYHSQCFYHLKLIWYVPNFNFTNQNLLLFLLQLLILDDYYHVSYIFCFNFLEIASLINVGKIKFNYSNLLLNCLFLNLFDISHMRNNRNEIFRIKRKRKSLFCGRFSLLSIKPCKLLE